MNRRNAQRIREVERGSFTPLVISATGGMGRAAKTAYRRLASLVAAKRNQSDSSTITWIRCLLSFSLLRSAIRCLRGARSNRYPVRARTIDVNQDVAIFHPSEQLNL